MARINKALTLQHRSSLDEGAHPIDFAAGDEVEILERWASHYLCRDGDGRLFNIRREDVDPEETGANS